MLGGDNEKRPPAARERRGSGGLTGSEVPAMKTLPIPAVTAAAWLAAWLVAALALADVIA